MPTLHDHLREEDQRDGVKGLLVDVVLLQFVVVEKIASRFLLFEGLLCLFVHVVQLFPLVGSGVLNELWHDGDLGEVVEGLVVAEVESVAHHVHLVQQTGRTLLQLAVHLVDFLFDLLLTRFFVLPQLVLVLGESRSPCQA